MNGRTDTKSDDTGRSNAADAELEPGSADALDGASSADAAGQPPPVDSASDTTSHDGDGIAAGPASNDQEAVPAADSTASDLARLESELAAVRDQFVRRTADFQNYRRRTEKERNLSVAFGKELVVQQILDVADDLRRSIEAASVVGESPDPAVIPEAFSSLRHGVVLVFNKLLESFEKLGVQEIQSVGTPFDEELHEAIMQQPATEEFPAGTVAGEIVKGYRMGDRVIRHAKVIVSG